MRLAGQVKGGFFPAPPEAVARAAGYLRPPPSGRFAIFDPCAGEGQAIAQLGAALNCAPGSIHAIELDDMRSAVLPTIVPPEAKLLAPASFFGCRIRHGSFSAVWCNPPFDDALAGGRVEVQFLDVATQLVVDGGVMLFVCPQKVIDGWPARSVFLRWYDRISVVPFPAEHRPYNEVVVYGRKRRAQAKDGLRGWTRELRPIEVYDLPESLGPGSTWKKVDLTDGELERALAASPLRQHLLPPEGYAPPSPPLALGTGHLALLLAGGFLDGLVSPEGEPPHVVRGVARKVQYVSDEQVEEAKGEVITKQTISERIQLSVRAVDETGAIKTFLQE